MGIFQAIKSEYDVVAPIAKKPLLWASKSAWRRFFVFFFLLGSISLSFTVYLNHLIDNSVKELEKNSLQRESFFSKNRLQDGIELVQMCIESISKHSENVEWYCQRAKAEYLSIMETSPQKKHIKRVASNNAYEYMVFDLKRDIRTFEYSEMLNDQKKPLHDELKLLTSRLALFSYIVGIFLLTLLMIYIFKKLKVRNVDEHC